jgi:hypothetical protein
MLFPSCKPNRVFQVRNYLCFMAFLKPRFFLMFPGWTALLTLCSCTLSRMVLSRGMNQQIYQLASNISSDCWHTPFLSQFCDYYFNDFRKSLRHWKFKTKILPTFLFQVVDVVSLPHIYGATLCHRKAWVGGPFPFLARETEEGFLILFFFFFWRIVYATSLLATYVHLLESEIPRTSLTIFFFYGHRVGYMHEKSYDKDAMEQKHRRRSRS